MRGPVITDEYMLTALEKEKNNRRIRESYALWMHNDDWHEGWLLRGVVRAEAKVDEAMKKNPWVRQCLGQQPF